MSDMKVCPECGVPALITGLHEWLDNGDIVQKRNGRSRLVFIESENIDPLLDNIEDMIGLPIEHVVVTAVRRAVRSYVARTVPNDIRELIQKRELDPTPVAQALAEIPRIAGYGGIEFVAIRHNQDEDDYYKVRMLEPFSTPLASASIAGAAEVVLGGNREMTCTREFGDTYMVSVFPMPHREELRNRMRLRPYLHRRGQVELSRCTSCGGPMGLADYAWKLDRGVISSKTTGRRMVIMGPQELDLIFDELRRELGDAIDNVVVEAQRRFTVNGFYSIDEAPDEEGFRSMLALRGLGDMKEIVLNRRRLEMRLDNAALHLIVIGMMQGVFDSYMDTDSVVEWELSADGSLELAVSRRVAATNLRTA